MRLSDVELQAGRLVTLYNDAPEPLRLNLRPEVDRVIQALKSMNRPVPAPLLRLKTNLEEEAYDELFGNMPV